MKIIAPMDFMTIFGAELEVAFLGLDAKVPILNWFQPQGKTIISINKTSRIRP